MANILFLVILTASSNHQSGLLLSLPSHHPAPQCNKFFSSVLSMEMLLRNLGVLMVRSLLPVSRCKLIYNHFLLLSSHANVVWNSSFSFRCFPETFCPGEWMCGHLCLCTHSVKTLQRAIESLHFSALSKAEECLPSWTAPSCFWSPLKVFHRENPCSGALESPCWGVAAASQFGVSVSVPWAKQDNLDSSKGVPGHSGLTALTQMPCSTQTEERNFGHVFHYHLKSIFPTGKKSVSVNKLEQKTKLSFQNIQ